MSTVQPSKLHLIDKHLADLRSSGLTPEQIAIAGHFSVNKSEAQTLIGTELPGLIFNYCDLEGKPYLQSDGKLFYRIKPDWGNLSTEDKPKYLSPEGQGCRPYFSRLYSGWRKAAKSTKIDLWETEGEKKGDCGCSHQLAVIAFGGVDSWVDHRDRRTGEELKESRALPELDEIIWKSRKVYQCYDSDIVEKPLVQLALAKRAKWLNQKGASPYLVLLPNEPDGSKNGLDDFVVRHGIEALRVLAKESIPTPIETTKKSESGEESVRLNLEEPKSHHKAVMAWVVLKETWAYCPEMGWLEWQGTHWRIESQDKFEAVLTRFMDAQGWQKRESSLISSIVRELKSRLLVELHQWNPVGKLAFANGALDLTTGFAEGHTPLDRLLKIRPYDFDLSAQCPNWLKFLDEVLASDRQLIELVQAVFRYAVLPRPRDRKAEIEKSVDLFGPKGTGKGTTLEVLINLVGEENIGPASPKTFKDPEGLGQLIDKDLAVDTDASGFLEDIGTYNKVVSNEPVVVKKLYQNAYTTRLGVLVVRAYNAHIGVPQGSEGLDRRLIVIPFRHQPKTVDLELSEKLRAELPGVFAWCYSLSHAEMKQRLQWAGQIPAIAEASIDRFEQNNPEYRYLLEAFPQGRESIQAGILYKDYKDWCRENEHSPKTQVKLRPILEALGCKRSSGKINGCYFYTVPVMDSFNVAVYLGIIPRTQVESPQSGTVEGDPETVRDNCRDSSNSYLARDRDSCRQLEAKTYSESKKVDMDENAYIQSKNTSQPSTTIPKPYPERISTVSEPSLTVPTVSQPSLLSCDRLEQGSSDPNPGFEERGGKRTAVVDLSESYPSNQPQIGDPVEVLLKGEEAWQPATMIEVPIAHTNPHKSKRSWKVKLSTGSEPYIWNREKIRLLPDGTRAG